MRIRPVGDIAISITPERGDNAVSAATLADALKRTAPVAVTDVLPAFDTVTVTYDPTAFRPGILPLDVLTTWIESTPVGEIATGAVGRLIELPVDYGGAAGPDLAELAGSLGLTPQAIVERHSDQLYTVAAVGFLPGFAYLEGLPVELHAPRRSTPRTRVPAGSVAIGGPYTGVYPVESPGGWRLIGLTTAKLFDPADPAAVRFSVGDRVRFVAGGGR